MATDLELLKIIAPDIIQPWDTVSSILRKLVQWPGGSLPQTDADLTRWLVGGAGVDTPSASDETLVRMLVGDDFDTDVNTTLTNLTASITGLETLTPPVINGASAEFNVGNESVTLIVSVSQAANPDGTKCLVYASLNEDEFELIGEAELVDNDLVFTDEEFAAEEGDEINIKVRFACGNERSVFSDTAVLAAGDDSLTVDNTNFSVDSVFFTADNG